MKKIVLKIQEGDLFRFFDSEDKEELFIGAKRPSDIVVRSSLMQGVQIRLVRKNDVWYAEDLTKSGSKSVVCMNGKPFRRPALKMDGLLSVRPAGNKEKEDIVRILPVRQIDRKRASAFDLTGKR